MTARIARIIRAMSYWVFSGMGWIVPLALVVSTYAAHLLFRKRPPIENGVNWPMVGAIGVAGALMWLAHFAYAQLEPGPELHTFMFLGVSSWGATLAIGAAVMFAVRFVARSRAAERADG
jgi:hypothetical protein